MNAFGHVALLGWIPFLLALFAILRPRTAVLAAFVAGLLFLPIGSYQLPGLPDYDKTSAVHLGVLLGVALFDRSRLFSFRPRAIDLPMLVYCVTPCLTSVTNHLGIYDGLSASLEEAIVWGLPYLVGRLYFSDLAGQRSLAVALLIGGLLYVPLCLYEIRMSPQLHRIVYGTAQHAFSQSVRLGGYRPMVFLKHGLMVGMWMAMASLVGIWLWRSGTIRRIEGWPVAWLLVPLVGTAVFCRALGALVLLAAGLAVLFLSKWLRTPVLLAAALMVAPAWSLLRATGTWSGETLVGLVKEHIDPERADSLQVRFDNENYLAAKALERPILGWGRWGRSRVYDEIGADVSTTDSLWIMALGTSGIVGLAATFLALLLPVFLFTRRFPVWTWSRPEVAPSAVLAMLLVLHSWDDLVNYMPNSVFLLALGALSGLVVRLPRRASRPVRVRRAGIAARAVPEPGV